MDTQEQRNDLNTPRRNNRVIGGLFLLLIGGVFLMREFDLFYFPSWLFTWPMILIAVGIFTGIKHEFRGGGWLVMLFVGAIFLIDQMDANIDLHRFLVPGIIIAIGLMLILRPKKRDRDWGEWGRWRGKSPESWNNWGGFSKGPNYTDPQQNPGGSGPSNPGGSGTSTTGTSTFTQQDSSREDFIDSTSVFGAVKKIILSKNFKGGDIVCFFGGAELDMTQADINGTVVIDITAILGGAKLIVPAHWEVKSEAHAIFGGIDDKRTVHANLVDPNKVLLIRGTAFMGGIEIRSY